MQKIWKRRWNGELPWGEGYDPSLGEIPTVIQNLLVTRGFADRGSWRSTFLPENSSLSSPLKLKGMDRALVRLLEAHRQSEPIALYADFDLDGTSGLALGLDAFKQLGFKEVIPYQPRRLSDGYGFHDFAVDELKARGVRLIVTIDVGITAIDACRRAQEIGVDVIVTDHHLPAASLPEAWSIINPNQGNCGSGLGSLCGAGVFFYLVRGLARALVDSGRLNTNEFDLKRLLDLHTIAAVTDMVPLISDNRWLVKQGLRVLASTSRPGLRALMERLRLGGDRLTTSDVGIRLAPKLNALSRLEARISPLDVYTAPTIEDAENLIDEVLSLNSDRADLQAQGDAIAAEQLNQWNHSGFIFVSSPIFHRGVVGLIATKLANDRGVPAFVGAESEDGVIVGSARAPSGSGQSVLAALESVGSLLNRFGGHSPAAGFELQAAAKDRLIEGMAQHFEAPGPTVLEVPYDLDLDPAGVSPGLLRWLESLEPFGVGFPSPVFRIDGLVIESQHRIKGVHLKLKLSGIEAMYFSAPPMSLRKGQRVSVLAEVQGNSYRSAKSIQLIIKDLAINGGGSSDSRKASDLAISAN